MTNPSADAMKAAEALYNKLLIPTSSLDFSDPAILIASVLGSFAEERVKLERKDFHDSYNEGKRAGRMEALKELSDYDQELGI